MPSPFPGMDPFLEHPSMFADLHGRLNGGISESLQQLLPDSYFAVMGERVFVETSERYIEPDVHVSIGRGGRGRSSNGSRAAAVLDRPRSEPFRIEIPHDERRETFVEVRSKTGGGQERIVTVIEVLSIANKTPGAKGRKLYRRKQEEMRDADINLVEIDLLRGGGHTTASPPEKLRRKAGPFDYHVCVRLFGQLGDCLVYANRLEEPLPVIAIPLLPADGSVDVNLQAVFDRCYDAGPYRRRIDYSQAPPPPALGTRRMRWMRKLIRNVQTHR